MSEKQFIYEVVDITDEEIYYPIGVFLTAQEAIEAIKWNPAPWHLCEMASEGFARIAIKQRKLGLDPMQTGKTVATFEWVEDYENDTWKLQEAAQ